MTLFMQRDMSSLSSSIHPDLQKKTFFFDLLVFYGPISYGLMNHKKIQYFVCNLFSSVYWQSELTELVTKNENKREREQENSPKFTCFSLAVLGLQFPFVCRIRSQPSIFQCNLSRFSQSKFGRLNVCSGHFNITFAIFHSSFVCNVVNTVTHSLTHKHTLPHTTKYEQVKIEGTKKKKNKTRKMLK